LAIKNVINNTVNNKIGTPNIFRSRCKYSQKLFVSKFFFFYVLTTLIFNCETMVSVIYMNICFFLYVFSLVNNVINEEDCLKNEREGYYESLFATVVLFLDNEELRYCMGKIYCLRQYQLHTCLYVLTSASCLKQKNVYNKQVNKLTNNSIIFGLRA